MKKIIVSIVAAVVACVVALALPQRANTVWNVTDASGTNDLVQIDASGNVRAQGSFESHSATGIVFGASAVTSLPTNTPAIGLRVRVNGTNYIIRLYLN